MRTGILLSLTRIWMSVCGLGITIAAVYFADPVGFGQFAIASSIGLFFCMMLGSGTHEGILARTVDPAEGHAFASVTGLVFAVVLCLLALASQRAETPVMTLTFVAYAVNCIGWGATNAFDAVTIREDRASRILVSAGAGDTVNLIVSVIGLFAGFDVYALAAAKLAQSIVQYGTFCAAYGRPILPSLRLRNGRRHLGGFGTYLLPRLSNWAESYAADIFIGALLSPVAAGQFRLAARFTSAFQSVILNSLNVVLMAEIGRRSTDALKTAWMLRALPQAVVLVGFAGSLYSIAVAAVLVSLKAGAWTDAAMVVLWISVATPAIVVNGAIIALLAGRQANERLANIQVSRLLATTLGLVGGALVGIVASAAGRSLAAVGATCVSLGFVLRRRSHADLLVSVLVRQSLAALIVSASGIVIARSVPGGLSSLANLGGLLAVLVVAQIALTFDHLYQVAQELMRFRPSAARLRRQVRRSESEA